MATDHSWRQREKVIKRVIALKAMGSDLSSPYEAKIALERAKKLTAEHKISQSEIDAVLGITRKESVTPKASTTQPPKPKQTPSKTKDTAEEIRKNIDKVDKQLQALREMDRYTSYLPIVDKVSDMFIKLLGLFLLPSLLVLIFKAKSNKLKSEWGYYESTTSMLIYDESLRTYLITAIVSTLLIIAVIIVAIKIKKKIWAKITSLNDY